VKYADLMGVSPSIVPVQQKISIKHQLLEIGFANHRATKPRCGGMSKKDANRGGFRKRLRCQEGQRGWPEGQLGHQNHHEIEEGKSKPDPAI
jgi:hypothetical protein